jgi:hypothetical protein
MTILPCLLLFLRCHPIQYWVWMPISGRNQPLTLMITINTVNWSLR